MLPDYKYLFLLLAALYLLPSCNTLEKVSSHGLQNGYYQLKSKKGESQKVYLKVTDEKIVAYAPKNLKELWSVGLPQPDTMPHQQIVLKKQSLDVDITSVVMKYRPSVHGLPAQLTTDFNIALYAGWRHDAYRVRGRKDPLGKIQTKINDFGYDFGVFAGPGTTLISSFTTLQNRTDEYSAMILQAGFAGFIESKLASFGLAVGYDYLMNPDREVWIYQNKPWLGFLVGIALN